MKKPLLLLVLLCAYSVTVAQQSMLMLKSYYSARLNRTVNYYILLPPGYDGVTEHYPALYMLRGAEWEWITPTQDGSRAGRDLRSIVDDLYAKGKIGKMIYVMPGLSQPGTDQELTAMVYEMFPYIDSVYRTIPTRWHRGVDGFSYGGLDEMNAVSIRPGAFATAASYDGSFFAFDPARVLNMPAEQRQQMSGIRFMHHSGGNLSGQTNYTSVRQLVDSMNARGWINEFADIRLAPNAIHNWWYADEHMIVTLPLHWQTFSHPAQSIQAQILAPSPAACVAGTVSVQWTVTNYPAASRVMLEYSADMGKSWRELFAGPAASTQSFSWNTTVVPDGAWYVLHLSVTSDTAYGSAQLSTPFTIDNPGNGAPAVAVVSLAPGDTVTGLTPVQWAASDPEGDSLTFALDLSVDGGLSWEPIASGLHGTDQYLWDSRNSPNCASATLRIRCSDGQLSSDGLLSGFSLYNDRTPVAASAVRHVAGNGDGRVIPLVVDPAEVLQHEYQVSFKDSAGKANRFSVYDLALHSFVLADAPVLGAGTEGPQFDGLRLQVIQPERPTCSLDSTRWLTGGGTLTAQVTLPEISVGDSIIRAVAYPADYLVTLYDHVVDTSIAYLGASALPMKFKIWNLTEERKSTAVFVDQDGDSQIGMFDEIIILEPGATGGPGVPGEPLLTWDIAFGSALHLVPPQAGDVFFLKILKPFSAKDTLRFTPVLTGIAERGRSSMPERIVLYQNYPNPFNPTTMIRYATPQRSHVTLIVYNTLGQQVQSLVNGEVESGYHEVQFNATGLASGVYFYRLQIRSSDSAKGGTPGFVQTRKLLLVR